jgi:glycosyltransferase involved in cell wall biosynthesis
VKVLFALPQSSNPIIQELADAIKQQGVQTFINIDDFWNKQGNYDIVHIHWPEALCNWREPNDDTLTRLENILLYWKTHSRCIITRHNLIPHRDISENFIRLYEIVFKYSNAVVHMGEYSLFDYKERYVDKIPENQIQSFIPHPVYTSFPNEITTQVARQKLGISKESFAMLVFGKVRNIQESQFIKKVFSQVKEKKKVLIVPHWYFSNNWIINKVEHILHKIHPQYFFTSKRIKNEDAQYFFNAADVVFIQRFGNLNSGNMILGFSFGKVVVGPDFGVIGEILRQTANPIYKVGNVKDAARAIEDGKELLKVSKGEMNLQYAKQNWNHERIAKLHLKTYNELLNL